MKNRVIFAKSLLLVSTLILLVSAAMNAQQAVTASTTALVPQLVNFSGKAINEQGKPVVGIVGITCSIYKEQYEGAPLWMETQNVTADAKGNYTVQLGAMSTEGLPLDVFTSGEARWLGVRVNGGEEQPRVLLLSVPYALKAADAQTLGGLPPSAFVLAGSEPASASRSTVSTSKPGKMAASSGSANTPSPLTTTGSGTKGHISIWTSSTSLGNSAFFQTGAGTSAKVGLGTTTPGAPLDVKGIINTSAGFNLGGKPFAFGSSAKDNAFLGFGGNLTTNTSSSNNTVVGVEALFDNTSGSGNTAVGSQALNSNTNGSNNVADGFGALWLNTTGSYNTALGAGALYYNTTDSRDTAVGFEALENNSSTVGEGTAVGYAALLNNTTGEDNTAVGGRALFSDTTGGFNTAIGQVALYSNTGGLANTATGQQTLYSNTTGQDNTADGSTALQANTTGSGNTAVGVFALYQNTTGGNNTALGFDALFSNKTGSSNTAVGENACLTTTNSNVTCVGANSDAVPAGLSNATAIGAHAVVGQSNSLVLGGIGEWAVKVGIGATAPSNVLTIGRGLGHPVSDSWETYSSRRWKTNIQTLPNALSKVEKLRGVSYDLKDSGKHEIGVIAEEVGQVVPEVVSYEKNGKDATGVDYSRLTALLIEAVKQQQKQIVTQQTQIVGQQKQIALQQSQIRKQQRLAVTQQAQMKAQEARIDEQQNQIRSQANLSELQQTQIARLSSQAKAFQVSLNTNGHTSSEIRTVKALLPMLQQ
jgi:trimeric autotransporter adhesin